jgi:hypothetical protein
MTPKSGRLKGIWRFTKSDSGSAGNPETEILCLINSVVQTLKFQLLMMAQVWFWAAILGCVQVLSRSKNPQIKLASKDGTEKVLGTK